MREGIKPFHYLLDATDNPQIIIGNPVTIQQLLDGQDEDRERERRDGSIDLASFSLEKEALRDNLARFIESILGQAVAAIQANSLDGPDNLFLLQASEVERDVPRIIGVICDFYINTAPV